MSLASLAPLTLPDVPGTPRLASADVDIPDTTNILVDADTGWVTTLGDDGSAVVDTDPESGGKTAEASDHDANLADVVDEVKLGQLANMLLEDIEADNQSRQKWIEQRQKGLTLLALEIEQPRGDAGNSAAPLEGMSSVRHPLLLEAVVRGASTASGELLPTDGPVKVRNDGQGSETNDQLAQALETDFNHYLTTTASEYYPDTDRMLLHVYFGGTEFKKVYNCPLRRRPVSDWVSANDIIAPSTAQNVKTAGRLTHQIMMRKSTMKRMQIIGAYRDVPLSQPQEDPNPVERKEASISGQAPQPDKPEQNRFTIYECYCELLPDEVGVDEKDAPEKLPLPYKVSIDKDSRKVLEIRRNWAEDDKNYEATQWFVKFPFVPGFGFYDIGLVNMLGSATEALTAAWRIALDSGMFANFPGFVFSKSAARQVTNEFRIPPGGGMPIDTDGQPLNQAIQPLPYKDVTSGMLQLIEHVEEVGQRLGGTADVQVGEGRQDAPVGTTIAMIEQATKVLDEVHKRLHRAQAEEFQILKARFKEDPEAFWRNNKSPSAQWDEQIFLAALNDCNIVPMADPNASSHIHRLMKVMALVQLAQATQGRGWNMQEVQKRALITIGFSDWQALVAPDNQSAQPDPKMLALQAQQQSDQLKAQMQAQNDARDDQREAAEQKFKMQDMLLDTQNQAAERANRVQVAKIAQQTELERIKADAMQNREKLHNDTVRDMLKPTPQPKGPMQ